MESDSPGLRRIDADEANRLSSELDGTVFNAVPVDDTPDDSAPALSMSDARDDLSTTDADSVFPPQIAADESIGGDPEVKAALREELTN